MTWQEEGQKQQNAFLDKIQGKIDDGKKLTGFERNFFKTEAGQEHFDFIPGRDDGEEKVIRYQE